jgi:hypothetical protein
LKKDVAAQDDAGVAPHCLSAAALRWDWLPAPSPGGPIVILNVPLQLGIKTLGAEYNIIEKKTSYKSPPPGIPYNRVHFTCVMSLVSLI